MFRICFILIIEIMKTIRIPVSDKDQTRAKEIKKITKLQLSAVYELAFLEGLKILESKNEV
jgi:hypothetical protein